MAGSARVSEAVLARLDQTALTLARADERVGRRAFGIHNMLLYGEGGWSWWIDGTWVPPREVAIAGAWNYGTEAAMSCVNVVTATEYAMAVLSDPARPVTATDLVEIHARVEPDLAGIREVPSWIVSAQQDQAPSSASAEAEGVPPPPESLPALVDEVAAYMSGIEGNALLRCAIAYAQLDSLHPFAAGNGRTARAVLHALLRRTGALRWTMIPLSTAFSRPMNEYFAGMAQFRRGPRGLDAWLNVFADAIELAATQAMAVADAVDELNARTLQRLIAHRSAQHRSPTLPRAGSVLATLVQNLSIASVMTIDTVHRDYQVSRGAAHRALAELEEAGILHRVKIPTGRLTCWVADDYLLLVTLRGVYTEASR